MTSRNLCLSLILATLFFLVGCGSSTSDSSINDLSGFFLNQDLNIDDTIFNGPTSPVAGGNGVPIAFGGDNPTDPGELPNLEDIVVTPSGLSLQPGSSATLSVQGLLSTNQTVDLPGDTSVAVSFQSANPAVAETTTLGVVDAIGLGTTEVTVTVVDGSNTLTRAVPVTVSQVLPSFSAFIYVADPANVVAGAIHILGMAPNGELTLLSKTDTGPNFGLFLSPDNSLLYNSDTANNIIESFSVNRMTGALTATGFSTPTGEVFPEDIVVHPNGQFVYAVHQATPLVTSFTTDNTGLLAANPSSPPIAAEQGATRPIFNLAGDRMYKVNAGSDSITMFEVDTNNGALSYLNPSLPHFGTSATATAVSGVLSRDGNFLFVANANDRSVTTYAIDANGALSLSSVSSPPTGFFPFPLAVHPILPVLYVANADASSNALTIQANGSLTILDGPDAALNSPQTIVIDPSGNFLYIVSQSQDLAAYSIGATGELDLIQVYNNFGLSLPSGAVIIPALATP